MSRPTIPESTVLEVALAMKELGEALNQLSYSLDPKYHLNDFDGICHDIRQATWLTSEQKAKLRELIDEA